MFFKIWKYAKWIGGAIIALGILALIVYQMWGKNKKKGEIDQKIKEIERIENKTAEDRQELDRLTKESDEIKKDIDDTAKRYAEKLKDLQKPKPPNQPAGDGGKAGDGLNQIW